MKKCHLNFITLALSLIPITSFADSFYVDAKDPNTNAYVFHDEKGNYLVTASATCNEKPGGRICITVGEGSECNMEVAPLYPNHFQVSDDNGKPVTTIVVRVSSLSPEGIACGIAEHGQPMGAKKIILK